MLKGKPVKKLAFLLNDKFAKINELHSYLIFQTEYEGEIALHKLEFRYDYDFQIDFSIFEALLNILYEELISLDGKVFEYEVKEKKAKKEAISLLS